MSSGGDSGELGRAGMNERHYRRAEFRRVNGAALFVLPRLTVAALVQFSQRGHHLLLPGEFHKRVFLTGHVKHRLGFELCTASSVNGGRGRDGGEPFPALRPEQASETTAIDLTCAEALNVEVISSPETHENSASILSSVRRRNGRAVRGYPFSEPTVPGQALLRVPRRRNEEGRTGPHGAEV